MEGGHQFKFNIDLLTDLACGRGALFLGAGVSSSAVTAAGRRIKGWGDFLASKLQDIEGEEDRALASEMLAKKDYLLACEVIRDCLGDRWEDAVSDEFQQAGAYSELHKALLSLKQRIIITTNFDKYLEASIGSIEGIEFFPKVYNGLKDDIFKIFRDDKQYIVKLHGTVDEPDTLIFAKSDYHGKAYGSWVYRDFIDVMLLTHTMVFVGFSMDDPAISLLVEMYSNKYKGCRPHYIFLGGGVGERMKSISRRLRKLSIIDYNKQNNHEELLLMVKSLAEQVEDRRREMAADLTVKLSGTSSK